METEERYSNPKRFRLESKSDWIVQRPQPIFGELENLSNRFSNSSEITTASLSSKDQNSEVSSFSSLKSFSTFKQYDLKPSVRKASLDRFLQKRKQLLGKSPPSVDAPCEAISVPLRLLPNPVLAQQSMQMSLEVPAVLPSLNSTESTDASYTHQQYDISSEANKGSALSLLPSDIQFHVMKWEKERDNDKEKGKVQVDYGQWPLLTSAVGGREEEKEELIKLLMSTAENSRIPGRSQVSIIAVTGVSSIGKTAFAQLVCSDNRVRRLFNLMAWLSQSFDCILLHKAITGSCNDVDLSRAILSLCEVLRGKTFLLVLDDIQPVTSSWGCLDFCLAHAEVATVLVTTRSERTARNIPPSLNYPLMGLSEEKCWSLFQKHAFDYKECYARELSVEILEEVGRKIIRRCGGFPLAVTMIGALLRYERDVTKWIDVMENSAWESNETMDTLLRAVRISYECMPSYLKQCLAYCSLFPADYKFSKEEVVNLWILEGLIQARQRKSIGEIGRGYFDELCRRFFLQRSLYNDDFCLPNLIRNLINKPENSFHMLQTNLRTDDPEVYCREEDETKLLEILLSDDRMKCYVTVVRVFGASGIGKTTLVNLVYNNSAICEIFETRAWVCANDKLDLKEIMKAILESLTGVSCSLTELIEIREAVNEELAGRNFFIVLDNICSDDLSFWNSMLILLSMGAKGSIIVATTDNEVVINTDMICSHELKRLSKNDSSLVLQQVVFDGRDYRTDPHLIHLVKHINRRCKGLPLVLKAFGGLMRAELDAESWAALLGSGSIAFDEVSPPLRLSYRQLNGHLKRCFEYCSLFPKGYIFEKDRLVRLWMSQGFIEHQQGKHEHDTANEYFDELLKRSFFQYSPNCHRKEKKFVMHDLFHDVAEFVSANECFRAESCEMSCIPEQVHHISLTPYEYETKLETASFQDLRDVTTILIVNRFAIKCKASIRLQNPAVLNDLFAQLRLLRTLDLSYTNIEVIPESIAYLQMLRYLGLNKTRIRRLPESICSLYNLQTLELQGCSYLSELPAYMKNLVNLTHLDVSKESGFAFMPRGIGQLTGLLTLSTFTIGRNEQYCGVKELKDLNNLRGALCVGGLGNVLNGDDAKEAKLEAKEQLRSLTIQWLNCDEDLQECEQSTETASKVLQNLLLSGNLEELTIRDYFGDEFPSWMGDPSFSKLICVTLENFFECDTLPPLGQLPSLKHLSLRMIDGVKCICHEVCGSGTSRGFPSLETLKLWEMSELEELCSLENGDFPCLRKLCIGRCNKLKKLPSFVSLMELSIHCYSQLPELPNLPRLNSLIIKDIQQLDSLHSRQFDLPALKFLEISNCYQLSSIEGLSEIGSLEKVEVTGCPKLNFSSDELVAPVLQVVDIGLGCSSENSMGSSATACTMSSVKETPKAPVASSSGITHSRRSSTTKTCQFQGCVKGARGASGLCLAHGGGRRCQRAGCTKGAVGSTIFCKAHGGGRRCQFLGCTKSAEGSNHCIAHGGGRRCSHHKGCNRAARGKSGLCIRHGSGKRCQMEGCTKSAEGFSALCISHGGGRRCQFQGCVNGARGASRFCKVHEGGRRCQFLNCTKSAEGCADYCIAHGGG